MLSFAVILWLKIYGQVTFKQIGNDLHGQYINQYFGYSVSLDGAGKTLAIGSPYFSRKVYLGGLVQIFENVDNEWIQKGNSIYSSLASNGLGWSVSLNKTGDILAIGVPYNQEAGNGFGKVVIYKYEDDKWNQLGNPIFGESVGDLAGWSVSINASGYTVAIGAVEVIEEDKGNGLIRIYDYNETIDKWEKTGDDIKGDYVESYFGFSLDINDDGNIVAAGGPDDKADHSGIVKIFERNNNNWIQKGQLLHGEPGYQFGWSLSFNGKGDMIAIGANKADNNNGKVKIFQFDKNNNNWKQIGSDIEGNDNWAGYSVALNNAGNMLSVGFSGDKSKGFETGLHKIFQFVDNDWKQIGPTLRGNNAYDLYGSGTDFNNKGNIFVVSAKNCSDYGESTGKVQIFEIEGLNSTGNVIDLNNIIITPTIFEDFVRIKCNKDNQIIYIEILNINGQKITSQYYPDG